MILALLLQGAQPPIAIPEEPYAVETSPEVAQVLSDSEEIGPEAVTSQLLALAEAGDASAHEALGTIHLLGLFGIERDPISGCQYFAQLDQPSPTALHNLAVCFEMDEGPPRDLVRARQYYRRAAEGGWQQSICAYGNLLIAGAGGPKDVDEGLRLCRLSALAGDANAQTDYGGYLLMGEVIERDPVAARFMFEQASTQQQSNAAFLLGQIYQKGDGVEASERTAREWFEKAHQWGRADSAFQVARIHARRGFWREGDEMRVIVSELELAISWFEIAADGDPDPDQREKAGEMISNLRTLIEAAS